MTIQCCKCKRLRNGQEWTETVGSLEGPVSHSYCPACLTETRIEHFSELASSSAHASAGTVAALLLSPVPA